jgi:hypothetical protein
MDDVEAWASHVAKIGKGLATDPIRHPRGLPPPLTTHQL